MPLRMSAGSLARRMRTEPGSSSTRYLSPLSSSAT
jgi:hypothetical protein